jgi:hypothetical protein
MVITITTRTSRNQKENLQIFFQLLLRNAYFTL